MQVKLFNDANDSFFSMQSLREAARSEVTGSSLIIRCAAGDRKAAELLHIGFWPFVYEFEHAIDEHAMPRRVLQEKYGNCAVIHTFRDLRTAVEHMRDEEGTHSAHWKKDALELGLTKIEGYPVLPDVKRLIDDAYSPDMVRFFAVLAGTEFIAEELSSVLVASPRFKELFERKRWAWGEAHLIPHDDGPSHLQIDMDLARAYSLGSDHEIKVTVEEMVLETVRKFGVAAKDVEQNCSR